ncbi:MAG: tetratricopeptide repeat protein [Bacteroidota bacterium]|nr:tetratricopeptide repeat protein [Bacteroidota bacterium]
MSKIFFVLIGIAFFCSYAQTDEVYNRFLLGNSYEQASQFEKARQLYEEVYKAMPNNAQFFDALIRVELQLKRYNEVNLLLDQRIRQNPGDINLYGLLGKSFYMMGNENKAFSVWDEGLKYAGDDYAYRIIANYAIDRRAFNKAADILKKGQSKSADPINFSFELANLYAITMQFKEAAEELASILKKIPEQVQMVQSRLLTFINKPLALKQVISVFENESRTNQVLEILAWLYQEDKQWTKAYEIVKKLDTITNSNGGRLLGFAESAYNSKEFPIALSTLTYIVENSKDQKTVLKAKYTYTRALEDQLRNDLIESPQVYKPYYKEAFGNKQKVKDLVGMYIQIAKGNEGTIFAYDSYYRAGLLCQDIDDLSDAEQYLAVTAQSNDKEVRAAGIEELGDIALKNGNLDKALSYFSKNADNGAISVNKRNASQYKLAKIYFYKGEFPKCKDMLAIVTSITGDNAANDAIELSLIVNTQITDSISLVRFAKGEFLTEQCKFREALEEYEKSSKNQNNLIINDLAVLRMAEMNLALDNYENSIKILESIALKETPGIYGDKALFLLGQVYQYSMKDYKKAAEIYENFLAKYPNSIYLDSARSEILNLRSKLS